MIYMCKIKDANYLNFEFLLLFCNFFT